MNALRAILAELAGLFVEDGAFAGAIALWLVAVAALGYFGVGSPYGRTVVFSLGLAFILIASVARASRDRS